MLYHFTKFKRFVLLWTLALLSLVAALLLASSSSGQQYKASIKTAQLNVGWRMVGFDGTRSFSSPVLGPSRSPVLQILINDLHGGRLAAIADDGSLIVIGDAQSVNRLVSYTPSGQLKWAINTLQIEQVTIGPSGRIYIACIDWGNRQEVLKAINQDSGQVLWSYQSGPSYSAGSDLVIGNDETLYLSLGNDSSHARVVAINTDGTEKWHKDDPFFFSPSYIVLNTTGTTLYTRKGTYLPDKNLIDYVGEGLSTVDGHTVYTPNTNNDYPGGLVFYTPQNKLYAYETANGNVLNCLPDYSNCQEIVQSSSEIPESATKNEHIITYNRSNGILSAFDDANNRLWATTGRFDGEIPIADGNSIVYYAGSLPDGRTGLTAIDSTTGNELWRIGDGSFTRNFPSSHLMLGGDSCLYFTNATPLNSTALYKVCSAAATPTPTPTPTPSPTPDCSRVSISTQPQSQTIMSGQTATLTVDVSETNPVARAFYFFQWFQGNSGDTSHPVTDVIPIGVGGMTYTTPALTTTTNYWVRADLNGSCPVNSNTATITVNSAPQQNPLVFIPGIMGSSLDSTSAIRSNLWPGIIADHSLLTLDPSKPQTNVIPIDAIPDVSVPPFQPVIIYRPLLDSLTRNGYREYNVNGDPSRRTTAGCDLSQQGNQPNLFVFAYDWRISNVENTAKLKDYIGCIQRFYPGTKVDVLTHSMGGLLARRYILLNPTDHSVSKLITIAAPWLGAPKAINVMETGEYDDLNRLVLKSTLRSLSEFFPSAHQLLPSRFYFGLGGRPFVKDGSIFTDYDQFVSAFDALFSRSLPGTTGKAFHDRAGQDDWRTDQSGVSYYHLYGQRSRADTIGTVYSTTITSRGAFGSKTYHFFNTTLIRGDKTVPVLSAERRGIGPGLDLNAPGATLKLFASSAPADDNLYEHTGLTQNTDVQNYVLSILTSAQSSHTIAPSAVSTPSVLPAYYVRAIGVTSITVMDTAGHVTNPLADQSDNGVPNVTTFNMGDKAALIITPTDQSYTITLSSSGDPMILEIAKGTDLDTSDAIRYQDLVLPAGRTAILKLTPSGIEALKYDADGDGIVETTVSPTVSVSGTSAQDVTPPTVSVNELRQQSSTQVTIAASDSESGVKAIYYSTDGSTFQLYTAPFNVDPYKNPVIYTFADDNVANRSSLVTYQLTAPASTLQFDAASYSVTEGAGHATINVTRVGDSSGVATIDYKTVDTDTFTIGCADTVNNHGSAYARCDFATVVGTLTFAPGETQKQITVPLIDDAYVEGDETFQVALSNATDATLGTPATATVTIHDNDVAGEPNPVFSSSFFVRQQYLDFLSREPDTSGFNAWLGVLNGCSDVNNNPSCDRLLVSQSFFQSQEFQLKGFYVFRFYKVAFNRLPAYSEIISDMSFVAGATSTEVFQRKAQLATNFTQRTEFANVYGQSSNAAYVNALLNRYQLTQITTPDPANPDGTQKVILTSVDLVSKLNTNTLTRAQVLRAIADSDEVGAAEFNNAFVAMQYYGYLRRTPETSGYQAWLNYLNAHPTDFRTMVNGFVNSQEYKLRFGQP